MKLIESSPISSFKNSSTIENFSIKFPKPQSLSASNKDKSAKINTHPPPCVLTARRKKQKKKKKQEKWKTREEKSKDENTAPGSLGELDNNHSDKSGPVLRSDEIS